MSLATMPFYFMFSLAIAQNEKAIDFINTTFSHESNSPCIKEYKNGNKYREEYGPILCIKNEHVSMLIEVRGTYFFRNYENGQLINQGNEFFLHTLRPGEVFNLGCKRSTFMDTGNGYKIYDVTWRENLVIESAIFE